MPLKAYMICALSSLILGIGMPQSASCDVELAKANDQGMTGPSETTIQLDGRWRELQRQYGAFRSRIRNKLAGRPAALAPFDRADDAWAKYVKAECDDEPFALYSGGTAVPNLALRCKVSLMEARLAFVEKEFAPLLR